MVYKLTAKKNRVIYGTQMSTQFSPNTICEWINTTETRLIVLFSKQEFYLVKYRILNSLLFIKSNII